MKTKTINELRRLNRLKKVYCSWFSVKYPDISIQIVNEWFSYIERQVRHRGILGTISHVKSLRLAYTKWFSQDQPPMDEVSRLPNGKPKLIGKYFKQFEAHPREHALTLTFLNVIRVFRGGNPPKIDDLENPFTGDPKIFKSLSFYTDDFVKGLRCPAYEHKEDKRFSWFYTTKNGPNGRSINTMYDDINLIDDRKIKDLFSIAGPKFEEEITSIRTNLALPGCKESLEKRGFVSRCKTSLSAKISVIPSPEGKTRTVALGTYGEQAALNPLHKYIFKILKRIPGDLTFDQGRGLTHLRKPDGHHFGSLDLKAATDRFPRQLQTLILARLIGEERAISGDRLMSQEFGVTFVNRSSKWSVGQPMGFLSSGAVFALCHHFVMYIAHRRARVQIRKQHYVILGDDVVISHDAVAIEYLSLIRSLGVEISSGKSHKSLHSFEIGKRWIHKGEEISPFSMVPLMEAKNWAPALINVFETESKRSWIEDDVVKTTSYYMCKGNGQDNIGDLNRATKLAKLSFAVWSAMNIRSSGHACFQTLADIFGKQWDFDPRVADLIAKATIHDTFKANVRKFGDYDDDDSDTILSGALDGPLMEYQDDIKPEVPRFNLEVFPQIRIFARFRVEYTNTVFVEGPAGSDPSAEMQKLTRSLSVPSVKSTFAPRESNIKVIQSNALIKDFCWAVKTGGKQLELFEDSGVPLEIGKHVFPIISKGTHYGCFHKLPSFAAYKEEGIKLGFGRRKRKFPIGEDGIIRLC